MPNESKLQLRHLRSRGQIAALLRDSLPRRYAQRLDERPLQVMGMLGQRMILARTVDQIEGRRRVTWYTVTLVEGGTLACMAHRPMRRHDWQQWIPEAWQTDFPRAMARLSKRTR